LYKPYAPSLCKAAFAVAKAALIGASADVKEVGGALLLRSCFEGRTGLER